MAPTHTRLVADRLTQRRCRSTRMRSACAIGLYAMGSLDPGASPGRGGHNGAMKKTTSAELEPRIRALRDEIPKLIEETPNADLLMPIFADLADQKAADDDCYFDLSNSLIDILIDHGYVDEHERRVSAPVCRAPRIGSGP